MIVVDSSVWIDYFRGAATPAADKLDAILGIEPVATGDLIMTEVLQGFRSDRNFADALDVLCGTYVLELGGQRLALRAARHYRKLRKIGITPRKTIDTIIATYCIDRGYSLLYSDRDFAPFVAHLGLRPAMHLRVQDNAPELQGKGRMQRYKNLSGDSGIVAFELGDRTITVKFHGGDSYLYTVASTGAANIATMQRLAREGKGLSTFISQIVRGGYDRKLD